jgi:hypothetical protein
MCGRSGCCAAHGPVRTLERAGSSPQPTRADADFEQVEGVQEHTSVISLLAEFLEDRELSLPKS